MSVILWHVPFFGRGCLDFLREGTWFNHNHDFRDPYSRSETRWRGLDHRWACPCSDLIEIPSSHFFVLEEDPQEGSFSHSLSLMLVDNLNMVCWEIALYIKNQKKANSVRRERNQESSYLEKQSSRDHFLVFFLGFLVLFTLLCLHLVVVYLSRHVNERIKLVKTWIWDVNSGGGHRPE